MTRQRSRATQTNTSAEEDYPETLPIRNPRKYVVALTISETNISKKSTGSKSLRAFSGPGPHLVEAERLAGISQRKPANTDTSPLPESGTFRKYYLLRELVAALTDNSTIIQRHSWSMLLVRTGERVHGRSG
jgi:hypothetical protein